jgi:hypothetical protein
MLFQTKASNFYFYFQLDPLVKKLTHLIHFVIFIIILLLLLILIEIYIYISRRLFIYLSLRT